MTTPGSISPNSIPPTDALTRGVGRSQMVALAAKAAERRDVLLRSGGSLLAPQPASRSMMVMPANGRVVLDLAGIPYSSGGVCVPIDDVYVQRRIRDGSLVRIS